MAKRPERSPKHPPEDRLPEWWKSASRRMDVVGHLAERVAPAFAKRPWLPLLLLLSPVLLLLVAYALSFLR